MLRSQTKNSRENVSANWSLLLEAIPLPPFPAWKPSKLSRRLRVSQPAQMRRKSFIDVAAPLCSKDGLLRRSRVKTASPRCQTNSPLARARRNLLTVFARCSLPFCGQNLTSDTQNNFAWMNTHHRKNFRGRGSSSRGRVFAAENEGRRGCPIA